MRDCSFCPGHCLRFTVNSYSNLSYRSLGSFGRFAWLQGHTFDMVLWNCFLHIAFGRLCTDRGQLIALLCTTSWSIVGATVLVAYVALVRFGRRSPIAAWAVAALDFFLYALVFAGK